MLRACSSQIIDSLYTYGAEIKPMYIIPSATSVSWAHFGRWRRGFEGLYMDSSSFASNLSMAVGSTAYVYPASKGGIR